MKKRILTAIALVITLALFFVLKVCVSDYFFDGLIAIIAGLATFESTKIFSKARINNYIYVPIAFVAVIFTATFLGIFYQLPIWLIIVMDLGLILTVGIGCFVWAIISKKTSHEIKIKGLKCSKLKYSAEKALGNIIACSYPTFMLMLMMILNHFDEFNLKNIQNDGKISIIILIFVFLIPIFTDTFAMLTGMAIGGKKLCPKISPKKTISGAVGGTVWCVLLSIALYMVLKSTDYFYGTIADVLPLWAFTLIIFFGSLLAEFGDLFESYLKRRANVKDSGNLLPGHGGVLDRVDSYVFVIPYLLLAFILLVI